MTTTTRLTDAELGTALERLDGWSRDGDKLLREYRFPDFVTAFAFMTGAALIAERMSHHPEWFNVYGTVRVHLTTHDAGGITRKDVDLARAMNELASAGAALRA